IETPSSSAHVIGEQALGEGTPGAESPESVELRKSIGVTATVADGLVVGQAVTVSALEGQTQSAYARIRQSIVEGRRAPGTRLVEQRLAEELDLSRTPVREALKMLEAEGLVVIERNVGAIVRLLDRQTVTDLYDLRARLESFGAGRAAAR